MTKIIDLNTWAKPKLSKKIVRIIITSSIGYFIGVLIHGLNPLNWSKILLLSILIPVLIIDFLIIIDSGNRIPENFFEHCDN